MNIKIFTHLMPWELDDAFQTFNKIALSQKYINPEDTLYIETCLNLSDYIIDWSKSELPKKFFIEKYEYISQALYECNHKTHIYQGDKLYGHLDFQREVIEPHIDYYMPSSPDIYFHQHAIFYLIEGAKCIKDDYFLITPEIPKLWDSSWDLLTNKNFKNDEHSNWRNQSIYDIIYISENIKESPRIEKLNDFKLAGWLDLYSKNFYEKLVPTFDDWHGYGPWDYFGIIVSKIAKDKFNVNINQYVLRNQVIFDKDIGIFQNKKTPNLYKKYLYMNDVPNQRKEFEAKFDEYLTRWMVYAKNNKII
jgi:hypothetical protein